MEITRLTNDFLDAKNSPLRHPQTFYFSLATHSVHRFGLVKIERDRSMTINESIYTSIMSCACKLFIMTKKPYLLDLSTTTNTSYPPIFMLQIHDKVYQSSPFGLWCQLSFSTFKFHSIFICLPMHDISYF
jgi:hypothetical protein